MKVDHYLRRVLRLCAPVLAVALAVASCSDTDPGENRGDPAEALIARATDAMGGEALSAVGTMRLTGTTTITNDTLDQRLSFIELKKKPGKWYRAIPDRRLTRIVATDGETPWEQSDRSLAPYALEGARAQSVNEKAHMYPWLLDLSSRGVRFRHLGTESVARPEAYAPREELECIRYYYPDGDSAKVCFVPVSALPRMAVENVYTSAGPVREETWWSEYRATGNVLTPYYQVTVRPGERRITVLDSVEINPDIPDSVFVLDAPVILERNQLRRLVGLYKFYDTGDEILVTRDHLELFVKRNDLPNLKIDAINDTLFTAGSGPTLRNYIFEGVRTGRAQSMTVRRGTSSQRGIRIR